MTASASARPVPHPRGSVVSDPADAPAALAWAGARITLQPIVSVATGTITAVEALTRFPAPRRPRPAPGSTGDALTSATEGVLTAARLAGYGVSLELRCLRAALPLRRRVRDGARLFVNLSPDALHALAAMPPTDDLTGVVVEITEHTAADPTVLSEDMVTLRERGAAIAVDDVGSGYAGLLRVAAMRPDFVKVDRAVVAGVGDSVAQSAVLESLVTLAHRLGAQVVAEGVERLSEVAELARFDVDHIQGYAIARPRAFVQPVSADVVEACRAARRSLLRGSAVFAASAGRTRDLYSLTATLAGADTVGGMAAALRATAAEIGVDYIVLSTLESDSVMREIAHAGGPSDCTAYRLEDYPATVEVMRSGDGLEVQLDDPLADAAECAVMRSLGWASLLMVPVDDGTRAFGVLELGHSVPRRWTVQDIAHARGLAEHLAVVMTRLSAGPVA